MNDLEHLARVWHSDAMAVRGARRKFRERVSWLYLMQAVMKELQA